MGMVRRRRRSENFYSGLQAVAATTDTGYETYLNGSRLFLPAGTNYCGNPRLVDEDANLVPDSCALASTLAGQPTITFINRGTHYAMRFQYTGQAGDAETVAFMQFGAPVGSFAPGDPFTASITLSGVHNANAPVVLSPSSKQAGGTTVDNPFVAQTIQASPTRHSVSFASCGGLTSYAQFRIYFAYGVSAGDIIDVTVELPQLEKSPFPTPYFDGDTADSLNANTYAWTGTANASTSTRAVTALAQPVALGSTGFTIAGRYSALWAHNDGAAHNLLTLMAGSDARATVYKHTDNKLYAAVTDGTDTATSASAAQTLALGTVNSFVARSTWEGTVDLMLNGVASTQGNASAVGAQNITSVVFGGTPVAYQGPVLYSPTDKGASWSSAVDTILRGTINEPELLMLKRSYMQSGDALFTGRQQDGSTLFVKE